MLMKATGPLATAACWGDLAAAVGVLGQRASALAGVTALVLTLALPGCTSNACEDAAQTLADCGSEDTTIDYQSECGGQSECDANCILSQDDPCKFPFVGNHTYEKCHEDCQR